MKELRAAKKCSLYFQGHNIHWIQAGQNRSYQDVPASVQHREGNCFLVSTGEDSIQVLYHHDPERLIEALQRYNSENLSFSPQGEILRITDEDEGDYLFSMSMKPLNDCATL